MITIFTNIRLDNEIPPYDIWFGSDALHILYCCMQLSFIILILTIQVSYELFIPL